MSEVIKTYKGTDKDLQCRGYQFEIGRKEVDTDAVRCGNKGFHACEAPFDVLRYYPLNDGNRYFESESGGVIDRRGADDSKLASSELTLKAEIGLPGLIKAQIAYTRKKAESGESGGDDSNLAGGNRSNLAGGDNSIIIGRNGCKAKGGKNSVIVLTEWAFKNGEYVPVSFKVEVVDGQRIKADTYYRLKDGEFEEAEK